MQPSCERHVISARSRSRKSPAPAAPPSGAAVVLAAVAEPNRIRLLRLLLHSERSVAQCVEHTGLAQSLVSKHLGRLIGAGLVQRRREGRHNYHSVVDPHGLQELLDTAGRLARPPKGQ